MVATFDAECVHEQLKTFTGEHLGFKCTAELYEPDTRNIATQYLAFNGPRVLADHSDSSSEEPKGRSFNSTRLLSASLWVEIERIAGVRPIW
jgi:hypothetical protein